MFQRPALSGNMIVLQNECPFSHFQIAYILLQRETTRVGVLGTQRKAWQAQREPIMPNKSPNVSRWNIDCIGSPHIGTCIGRIDLMLFVSISVVLGSQHERGFWWNMGFTLILPCFLSFTFGTP